MAKKQKFLKILASVSVASIVATSSSAFANFNIDYAGAGAGGAINLSDAWAAAAGAAGGSAVFNVDNLTLTVDDAFPNAVLDGILVTEDNARTTIGKDITIGTIVDNGHTMAAAIAAGKTLTLTGNNHTGLGITTLADAGSTLKLEDNAILPDAIATATNGEGILTFLGDGTVTGNIGDIAGNGLKEVNIGPGPRSYVRG